MQQISITTQLQQGPIAQGFNIDLEGDYVVLVGRNNAGKSSILQYIFKYCSEKGVPLNRDNICLLLPERIFVDSDTQVGSQTLDNFNYQLASTINSGNNKNNRQYNTPNSGPYSSDLPKLLLNHTDFHGQIGRLIELMDYFDLPKPRIQRAQEVMLQDISIMFQGSGLRSIFGILAALTDENIRLLLIDEPELGLEARNQRLLSLRFNQRLAIGDPEEDRK